jgi:hypothetical protein
MFTTIAFGICAYLVAGTQGLIEFHPTVVVIGSINNGICNPNKLFPDTRGERIMIEGHEYGVAVVDDGATLFFDNKMFFFQKGSI